MNSAFGSTSVTSMRPSLHMRKYFAAVAPPNPPPTTTTLGLGPLIMLAQPGSAAIVEAAPIAFRKSRRWLMGSPGCRFLGCEPTGDKVDLFVGKPFGELLHDGRRRRTGLEACSLRTSSSFDLPASGSTSPTLWPLVP
jgi:hypothetical protein